MMRVERIGNATLYLGNALDIPNLKADAIITDPPYSSGGFNESGKSGGSIGTETNARIQGDTMSTLGYFNLMRRTLAQIDAQGCYVFTDWRMWPHTCEVVELAMYRLRGMIVWNKGSPAMGARWKMQHELICWGTKVSHKMGPGLGNVLTVPRSGNKEHPTEKPLALMKALVGNAEGDSVVDPFMGSGTTGVAAIQAGKSFVGCEIDPQHFDTACRRISDALTQGDLLAA
jgi:DNA modification methylase